MTQEETSKSGQPGLRVSSTLLACNLTVLCLTAPNQTLTGSSDKVKMGHSPVCLQDPYTIPDESKEA